MGLIRPIPLADFTVSPLSTSQVLGHSTAPPQAGQAAHAGLILTSISTGRTFAGSVQASSSSGFGTLTTEFQFALTSEIGSTWKTLTAPSTDQQWRRFNLALSTAASTAGSWTGLAWVGFK